MVFSINIGNIGDTNNISSDINYYYRANIVLATSKSDTILSIYIDLLSYLLIAHFREYIYGLKSG